MNQTVLIRTTVHAKHFKEEKSEHENMKQNNILL